jgi:hypothetical protein
MSGDLHTLKYGAALLVAALVAATDVVSTQAPIRVLLVTGQSNRYHNWEVSSPDRQTATGRKPALRREPDDDAAERRDAGSGYVELCTEVLDYQVVVLDYEGFEFAPPVKQALVELRQERRRARRAPCGG